MPFLHNSIAVANIVLANCLYQRRWILSYGCVSHSTLTRDLNIAKGPARHFMSVEMLADVWVTQQILSAWEADFA